MVTKRWLSMLFLLLFVIMIGRVCLAGSIQLDPHMIELVTEPDLSNFGWPWNVPGPSDQFEIQGEAAIRLSDPQGIAGVKFSLKPLGPEREKHVWGNVSLRYAVVWGPGNLSEWSEWVSLQSLPLTISLNETNPSHANAQKHGQDEVTIFLGFKVPQSPAIRQGKYHAHLEVECIEIV